jgi:hypothetical protein
LTVLYCVDTIVSPGRVLVMLRICVKVLAGLRDVSVKTNVLAGWIDVSVKINVLAGWIDVSVNDKIVVAVPVA